MLLLGLDELQPEEERRLAVEISMEVPTLMTYTSTYTTTTINTVWLELCFQLKKENEAEFVVLKLNNFLNSGSI